MVKRNIFDTIHLLVLAKIMTSRSGSPFHDTGTLKLKIKRKKKKTEQGSLEHKKR